VANHSFDDTEFGDVDVTQWALGVIYKYNPSVQFGLIYSKYDADDDYYAGLTKDPSIIRFRTWVAF
jgi:phosphate-selective porin